MFSLIEEPIVSPSFYSRDDLEEFRQRLIDKGWDWFDARRRYRIYYWFSEPCLNYAEGCLGFSGERFLEMFNFFDSEVEGERVFQTGRCCGLTFVALIDG